MGGHFLLLLQVFTVDIIFACLPREYNINNICCPMCDKGSFVKAHCTKELSSSVCVICADTTYMDHPNGLTECFRCKECDRGASLVVKQKCTASSNTICECSAGHFCTTPDCDICQEHKPCQPGEYVQEPGTLRSDTVCVICPSQHFSNETNSSACIPWKKCIGFGNFLDKEGTSTSDSICKVKNMHLGLIILLIGLPLSAIMIYCFRSRFIKTEKKIPAVDSTTNLPNVVDPMTNLLLGQTDGCCLSTEETRQTAVQNT